MLEELGRQLLGAFYSSLSLSLSARDRQSPAQGPPLYHSHLSTPVCVDLCIYIYIYICVCVFHQWHTRSLTYVRTFVRAAVRACTHACAQTHKHRLPRCDLPPSLNFMTVQVPCACVLCLYFPASVKGPYEISNLDKVERWAASHMSVYYQSHWGP